jgi:hypothetical protein
MPEEELVRRVCDMGGICLFVPYSAKIRAFWGEGQSSGRLRESVVCAGETWIVRLHSPFISFHQTELSSVG